MTDLYRKLLEDMEENTLCLDVVYVIDATADMRPYIDAIKGYAYALHQQMIKNIK